MTKDVDEVEESAVFNHLLSSSFVQQIKETKMVDLYSFVGICTIVLAVFYLIGKIFKGIWTTWLGSALGFGYNFKHDDDAFAVVTGKF